MAGTRQSIEETFHDKKAAEPLRDFYVFNPLEIADAFSVAQLGDVKGKRLLKVGCGDGRLATQFARAGAYVTGIDISREMVQLTSRAAEQAGLKDMIVATQMNAEELFFADESFDLIYGYSILHHLDLNAAARQLARVLRNRGIAVFLEPLGNNPLLRMFRYFTPQRRTPTEEPFPFRQLTRVGREFRTYKHQEFYLLSLGAFIWYYGYKSERPFKRSLRTLHKLDQWLFRKIPPTQRYAWVSVLTCAK